MVKTIKIEGTKYTCLAEFNDLSKVEKYVSKYQKKGYNIFILKPSNRWLIYGNLPYVKKESEKFEDVISKQKGNK